MNLPVASRRPRRRAYGRVYFEYLGLCGRNFYHVWIETGMTLSWMLFRIIIRTKTMPEPVVLHRGEGVMNL